MNDQQKLEMLIVRSAKMQVVNQLLRKCLDENRLDIYDFIEKHTEDVYDAKHD